MKSKIKIVIGALLIVLLATGVIYLSFDNVKFRIDKDKSTFYTKNANNRFVVSGREYSRLFDGTSRMNRRRSDIKITTNYSVTPPLTIIKRTTPYIRGPVIIDTYTFKGDIKDVELFPIEHKVEIYNAKSKLFRYEVRDLDYNGPTQKLTKTSMVFGKNMKVTWQDGYNWARIYKTKILKVQYRIKSDYDVFYVRLFDPLTPLGNLLWNDTFNRADTGDIGNGWVKELTEGYSNYTISSNRLYVNSTLSPFGVNYSYLKRQITELPLTNNFTVVFDINFTEFTAGEQIIFGVYDSANINGPPTNLYCHFLMFGNIIQIEGFDFNATGLPLNLNQNNTFITLFDSSNNRCNVTHVQTGESTGWINTGGSGNWLDYTVMDNSILNRTETTQYYIDRIEVYNGLDYGPDSISPEVFSIIPVNGTGVDTSVTELELGVNVTDNRKVSVVYANITYPNGTITKLTLTNTSDKYNGSFSIPNLTGDYTVVFIANDSTNNMNDTETTIFIVKDLTDPLVFNLLPTEGVFNVSDSIQIGANVTDDINVSVVFVNVTLPNGTVTKLTLNNSANTAVYNVSYTIPELQGQYNLTFIANDTSNNINSTESLSFTVWNYSYSVSLCGNLTSISIFPANFTSRKVEPISQAAFNCTINVTLNNAPNTTSYFYLSIDQNLSYLPTATIHTFLDTTDIGILQQTDTNTTNNWTFTCLDIVPSVDNSTQGISSGLVRHNPSNTASREYINSSGQNYIKQNATFNCSALNYLSFNLTNATNQSSVWNFSAMNTTFYDILVVDTANATENSTFMLSAIDSSNVSINSSYHRENSSLRWTTYNLSLDVAGFNKSGIKEFRLYLNGTDDSRFYIDNLRAKGQSRTDMTVCADSNYNYSSCTNLTTAEYNIFNLTVGQNKGIAFWFDYYGQQIGKSFSFVWRLV